MRDTELVQRIVEGDEDAFAELLARYQPWVYRLACRLVSPSEADDVTQDVFIEVYKSLRRFRGESSFSTWLYRVTFNRCQSYRLRQARQPAPEERESEGERPDLDMVVEGMAVAEAMEKLDDRYRDVLVLHELHGLTYAEIAEIARVPIGTVKSRLFHALRKLRGLLTEAPAEAAQ